MLPRRSDRTRKGIAAVELAVCLPMMMILAMGTLETTDLIFLRQRLDDRRLRSRAHGDRSRTNVGSRDHRRDGRSDGARDQRRLGDDLAHRDRDDGHGHGDRRHRDGPVRVQFVHETVRA